MPKKPKRQPKPLYRRKPPKGWAGTPLPAAARSESKPYHSIAPSHFELREDGSIQVDDMSSWRAEDSDELR